VGLAPLRAAPDVESLAAAYDALSTVIDPELDEPITDLGFVRSLEVVGGHVVAHLRLPTSFCAPNFAYLMASDAKDALAALPWTRDVVVELDDHHDSELINAGLAADAGYRGTFRHEADQDLDELRETFQRKAHTAAMERCLTALLRAQPHRAVEDLGSVTLGDLPDDDRTAALRRRRAAIGLPDADGATVLVDHEGRGYAVSDVLLALRRPASRSTATRTSAVGCCAPATRGRSATRSSGPTASRRRTPSMPRTCLRRRATRLSRSSHSPS
jgi:metal-sulfur cluster biosynthetic enzyme